MEAVLSSSNVFLFILRKHLCIPRVYPPWPWCMTLCVPEFSIYAHCGYWSIASLCLSLCLSAFVSVSVSLCLCACRSLAFGRVMLASQNEFGAVLSLCIVWNSLRSSAVCLVGFRSGGVQQ